MRTLLGLRNPDLYPVWQRKTLVISPILCELIMKWKRNHHLRFMRITQSPRTWWPEELSIWGIVLE